MTATTTPRDFLSPTNGRVPNLDSPGVSTPAHARITPTQSDGNSKTRTDPKVRWLARQTFWTARPDSQQAAWAASRVDRKRVPNDSGPLRVLWKISNGTDRLLLFALIQIVPTVLQGPLRWIAQRPTRRIGLYLVVGALTITLLIGRSTS